MTKEQIHYAIVGFQIGLAAGIAIATVSFVGSWFLFGP